MYIVRLNDYRKHSIWNTVKEAVHQRKVLENHGYRDIEIERIETQEYSNGQYFV